MTAVASTTGKQLYKKTKLLKKGDHVMPQ